jgi:excisionase family DNA binding protein
MTIKTNGEYTMEVRLLKGKEVAEMLGVSNSFAYLLMKRGDIPTIQIGSAVRVRLEDLEQYLREKATQNERSSRLSTHRA